MGKHNISVSFGGAFAGASACTDALPTLIDPASGQRYHMQVYPEVHSVVPQSLPCSGAVVTVTGAGFPTTGDGAPATTLDVRIGGVRCSVLWSNATALQCTAWQHPRYAECLTDSAGVDAAVEGLTRGMRGVLWESFSVAPGVGFDAWRAGLPSLRGGQGVIDLDNFTLPWALRAFAARGSAVFTAPVTGMSVLLLCICLGCCQLLGRIACGSVEYAYVHATRTLSTGPGSQWHVGVDRQLAGPHRSPRADPCDKRAGPCWTGVPAAAPACRAAAAAAGALDAWATPRDPAGGRVCPGGQGVGMAGPCRSPVCPGGARCAVLVVDNVSNE